MASHDDIRIGTLVKISADTAGYLSQILPHGFESFQIVFGRQIGDVDLPRLAGELRNVLSQPSATISSLGLYGNPLTTEEVAADWARLIDAAELFGCKLVCGFTGR